MTLVELHKGEYGIIDTLVRDEHTLKLIEMGFYKGRIVTIIEETLFADPLCVSISDSKVLLRRSEARKILITKCESR
jgi:Fe2+ transport system protein FeoA